MHSLKNCFFPPDNWTKPQPSLNPEIALSLLDWPSLPALNPAPSLPSVTCDLIYCWNSVFLPRALLSKDFGSGLAAPTGHGEGQLLSISESSICMTLSPSPLSTTTQELTFGIITLLLGVKQSQTRQSLIIILVKLKSHMTKTKQN